MIKRNVMYHNIDYVEETPLGDRLFRYPEEVLKNCNQRCRMMARYSCNSELRFVTDSDNAFVRIGSFAGDGDIVVYYGDFCVGQYKISAGETKVISLTKPHMYSEVEGTKFFDSCIYGKNVIRIQFHAFMAVVGEIDAIGGEIRPPEKEELPLKTMLAYGSSITHGSSAFSSNLCYAQTAARYLKSDIINKGVGGSCHAEPAVADWLAERDDWDFAYAEIGINMIGSYSPDEFKKRYTYFFDRISQTGKHIFAPSIYTYSGVYTKDSQSREYYESFNNIIREYHKTHKRPNVHFIDGDEILTETRWLSSDGLHPSTEGHALMGFNVAQFIKKYI